MQEKQKVTLYLPPGVHKQLKIKSAVDSESMSTLVEKALRFYLSHSEIVEELETSYGRTHRVYSCPNCSTSVVLKNGELESLVNQPGILTDELTVGNLTNNTEEKLVTC
ncbi:MAG TPA: hypothetical protein V6C58_05560 [Allocoleopsis sp.]